MFNRVVNDIRGLVNAQIRSIQEKENKAPKAIILVGDFGCSSYLFQTLYKEHEGRGIDVLQSDGFLP